MRRSFRVLLGPSGFLLALVCSAPACATEAVTNVDQVVRDKLRTAGKFPVTITWTTRETVRECFGAVHPLFFGQGGEGGNAGEHACTTSHRNVQHRRVEEKYLEPVAIQIVSNDLPAFGAPVIQSFPSDATSVSQENLNCSRVTGSANIALSLQASRSSSITLSKSITRVQSKSVGFQATFFNDYSASGSLSFGTERTSAESRLEATSTVFSISASGTAEMPPKSRTISTLSSFRMRQSYPFTMRVVVDGHVSVNDAGKNRISDVLSEADRTFIVEGALSSDNASSGSLALRDAPLNPAQCTQETITGRTGVGLNGVTLSNSHASLSGVSIK